MLVLASSSPRRQELLRNAGIPFTVQPAHIDESRLAGESPRDCALRLARDKAQAIFRQSPHQVVLGADTLVVVDDTAFGKPSNPGDAERMLAILSGRTHCVITGVCLIGPVPIGTSSAQSWTRAALETTVVTVSSISRDEIRDYVATGEPMDKAGAYAIQGIASRWIPRIEGDYSNVVGLPVALVYRMLRESGAL